MPEIRQCDRYDNWIAVGSGVIHIPEPGAEKGYAFYPSKKGKNGLVKVKVCIAYDRNPDTKEWDNHYSYLCASSGDYVGQELMKVKFGDTVAYQGFVERTERMTPNGKKTFEQIKLTWLNILPSGDDHFFERLQSGANKGNYSNPVVAPIADKDTPRF